MKHPGAENHSLLEVIKDLSGDKIPLLIFCILELSVQRSGNFLRVTPRQD